MIKTGVAIIIVTFNSEKYIKRCVESVEEADTGKNKSRIVVIDNNSWDGTVEKVLSLATKYKNIELIQNKENIGFARAINIGIKKVQSDYILLLNPDTVSNKLSILSLINCAEKHKAGIVGGSTFDSNGVENGSCFRFPTLKIGIFDFTNFRKFDENDKTHKHFYYLDSKNGNKHCYPVDVVTGGFMLISSNTVKKIGYLDERYFMYLEDVDYCVAARNAKIKVFHSNDSKIIHYSGRSSKNKDGVRHQSWIMSRKKYYLKHFSLIKNLIIQPIFILDDVIILCGKILKG